MFRLLLLFLIFLFARATVTQWVSHPLKPRQLAAARVATAVFLGMLAFTFFARYRWLHVYGAPTWPQAFPYPDSCLAVLETLLNRMAPKEVAFNNDREYLMVLYGLNTTIVLLTLACGSACGVACSWWNRRRNKG